MLVKDAIAEILKREKTQLLFGYPTTAIIEAAADVGIRPIVCRQERVGVDMAHGYARVTNGKSPAVFAMQYGPGAENAFSGIATAYSDSAPILLLPLGHPRERAQVPPMFKSTRTYATVTRSVEDIGIPEHTVPAMRRAFARLRNGRLGPALVEVPEDVLTMEAGDGAKDYRPVRATRIGVDPDAIEEAAELLVEAACPVIQAGQGVLYAQASAELVALAELLQAPVFTTVDGKSAFPEDHPLSLGTIGLTRSSTARTFLAKADVVFAIGSSLSFHPLVNPDLDPRQKIIHATNDPRDFYRRYDCELPMVGDAKLLLQDLILAVKDRLGKTKRDGARAAEIAALDKEWMEHWKAKLESNETPLTPYRVMWEFIKAVDPAGAIVTHDSGSPRDQLLPFYKATRPNSYIGWGKSHALGTGLGLTIGAKLAAPDKFCVNFMGDAAFGMTGLDFETAARCDIPILTIVLNNATMAVEKDHMKLSHAKFRTRDIGGNYANIARDLGGWSERVTDPNEIRGAILRARRETENGKAALLEFITSEERDFSHHRFGAGSH